MTLVVDASAAIKWVVAEDGRDEAIELCAGQVLAAPDFVLIEASNILWKKVRRKELDAPQTAEGIGFIRAAFAELFPSGQLIEQALGLALDLDHPVYDCLYIAYAMNVASPLLTADRRMASVAGAAGVSVVLLKSAP